MLLAACGGGSAPENSAAQWHVSAVAAAGGDGSRAKPFDSLEAVEQASAPGDTILVLAAPLDALPLDGGIALKAGQRLLGEARTAQSASRITNRSDARNDGDAVVLAPDSEVARLLIEQPHRGGIYGRNTPGVNLHDNEIAGHNQSCTLGLMIAPITIPSSIPGIVVPQPAPLPNGWAGIMIDADSGSGLVRIDGNEVRDSACGDGIDLRMSGSADYEARVVGNTVHGVEQGPPQRGFLSVLAMGMQTRDRSRLRAWLDRNTQYDIGDHSQTTDSEGVFANLVDESELVAEVTRNTFHHGYGGFSANGLELVISSGAARAVMTVRDSSFSNVPGDVLEGFNFGRNAYLELVLDNVVATDATGAPVIQDLIAPLTYAGNQGDCLTMTNAVAGNTMILRMRDSRLENCVNNGLTISSNALLGSGAVDRIEFEIDNSRIVGNRGYNLRLANLAPVTQLRGRVQGSDLGGSGGINLGLEQRAGGDDVLLDFGGGALGSRGGNCLDGGARRDLEILGVDVSMQHNWWGQPNAPGAERTRLQRGTVLIEPVLRDRPAGCLR